jgi:glycosyltransferase involved in cell wall biosynthesis
MFGRDGEFSSQEIASLIRGHKLEDVVFLAGFRTPAERNIAALNMLLVPALREPFGRTPVEALLLGVSYVATYDAGHIEILRKWGGGRGVGPEANPVEFADAAQDVLRAAEGTALSPDRRREIAEQLSPSAHAEAVMAIYQKFMKSRSRWALANA